MHRGIEGCFRWPLIFWIMPMWLFLCADHVQAQQQRSFELRVAGGADAMTDHVRKVLYHHATSLDPEALLSFHEDLCKLRLRTSLQADELLASINALGVGTFHFNALPPTVAPGERKRDPAFEQVPPVPPEDH